MPMAARGIPKLIEECGELQQVLGKRLAYYRTIHHPDGSGSLRKRMAHEMGDVLAAIEFVAEYEGLDMAAIEVHASAKLAQFRAWDAMQDNNSEAVDAAQ